MKTRFLLNEAAKAVGVPGYRIAYAITNGHLPEARERINNHRVFERDDIERMKRFFAARTVKRKEAHG